MRLLYAVAVVLLWMPAVMAAECDMEEVGIFNDADDSEIVKRPIYRSDSGRAATFYVTRMRVNTDGARKSYHPDDPLGNAGLAINHIGNGISVTKNGQSVGSATEVEVFGKVRDNEWRQIPGFRLSMANVMKKNLTQSDNTRFVPCIDDEGYLVSRTSFIRVRSETHELLNSCTGDYFFDAVETPHFVFPGREGLALLNSGATPGWKLSKGDVGAFYYPATKQLVYAIAADIGPADRLGEGSVNLDFNLKCRGENPHSSCLSNVGDYKTYKKTAGVEGVLSLDIPDGVYAVVFPRSTPRVVFDQVDGPIDFPITDAKFTKYAELLFLKWGGGTQEAALERLAACGSGAKARQDELN